MSPKGYVYVLANSAMPGLVKVGKTQRLPAQRAQELSGSTGTPTPFIVVYEQLFEDCDAAEEFIHTVLKQKGIRESDNREFFRASPRDVIEIVIAAPGKSFGTLYDEAAHSSAEELIAIKESDELDEFSIEDSYESLPWSGIWEQAENAYYGLNDTIQDYDEAMQFYIQAARLGCPMAYRRIGGMYECGEGVRNSNSKALEFYKKGAREGDYYCYLSMASMFRTANQQDNYQKAIKLLFKSRREKVNTIIERETPFANVLTNYIVGCIMWNSTPVSDIREEMSTLKGEILEHMESIKRLFNDKGNAKAVEHYNSAIQWTTTKL